MRLNTVTRAMGSLVQKFSWPRDLQYVAPIIEISKQTVIKSFTSCERQLGMEKFPVKSSSGQKKLKLKIISK